MARNSAGSTARDLDAVEKDGVPRRIVEPHRQLEQGSDFPAPDGPTIATISPGAHPESHVATTRHRAGSDRRTRHCEAISPATGVGELADAAGATDARPHLPGSRRCARPRRPRPTSRSTLPTIGRARSRRRRHTARTATASPLIRCASTSLRAEPEHPTTLPKSEEDGDRGQHGARPRRIAGAAVGGNAAAEPSAVTRLGAERPASSRTRRGSRSRKRSHPPADPGRGASGSAPSALRRSSGRMMTGMAASTKADSFGLVTTIMTTRRRTGTRCASAIDAEAPKVALSLRRVGGKARGSSPVCAVSKKAASSVVRCRNRRSAGRRQPASPMVITR